MPRLSTDNPIRKLLAGERVRCYTGWFWPTFVLGGSTILVAMLWFGLLYHLARAAAHQQEWQWPAVAFGSVLGLMFTALTAHLSGLYRHAAVQVLPEALQFWDSRGRVHRIPWEHVREVEDHTSVHGGLVIWHDTEHTPDEEWARIVAVAPVLAEGPHYMQIPPADWDRDVWEALLSVLANRAHLGPLTDRQGAPQHRRRYPVSLRERM